MPVFNEVLALSYAIEALAWTDIVRFTSADCQIEPGGKQGTAQ